MKIDEELMNVSDGILFFCGREITEVCTVDSACTNDSVERSIESNMKHIIELILKVVKFLSRIEVTTTVLKAQ